MIDPAKWLDDEKIAELVGKDWLVDFKPFGSRAIMVRDANEWLRDRGRNIVILDVIIQENNILWEIE